VNRLRVYPDVAGSFWDKVNAFQKLLISGGYKSTQRIGLPRVNSKVCSVSGEVVREDIKTESEKEVGKWYDPLFRDGACPNTRKYNQSMLRILDMPEDRNLRLLDVACGGGNLLLESESVVSSFGIDISRNAVKEAKRKITSPVAVASAEHLPFKDGVFDYMACLGSLEHFIDMDKALKEMQRVLKGNGKVNIHVPNLFYAVIIAKAMLYGISPTHDQINERFASYSEWKELIERYFRVVKCHKYNTRFYLKWLPRNICCPFSFVCAKEAGGPVKQARSV
jgi:ubiquinone/menaquinone biosynthesis C-methylase UbiE